MRRVYEVSVELPPGCDSAMMAEYVWQAVASWSGGMDPEHPVGCEDVKPVVTYRTQGITHQVRERQK